MFNPNTSSASLGQSNPSNMTIEHMLSPTERPYYYNLFSTVSVDGQFTDDRLIELLRKTGLSNPQLKELWIKYANNSNRITKLQFFTMMRAVALMQNGVTEDVDQYLLARNFPYFAKIQGIQPPAPPMTQTPNPSHMNVAFAPVKEEDQRMYEEMIDRSHTNVKGLLRAAEAKNILMQSGLEQTQLKQIWELCDRSEEGQPGSGKGFLKRNEWILCLHLITYSKKGWPLPKILPPELEHFLANYSQMRMQSEQGFGSQSFVSMGNSQASLHHSYSLNQPTTPLYQQSTVVNESVIGRTATMPTSIPGTTIGSSGSLPQSQIVKSNTLQSVDMTALTSLLDRVLKGYELLSKKYSDETDTFLETFSKLTEEKQTILQEISHEIEMLAKEMEDSANIKVAILNETQTAITKSRDTALTEDMNRLVQNMNKDQSSSETHDVLKKLKNRLESGSFPIRTDSLPEHHVAKPMQPPMQSYAGSAMQQRSPPPQYQYPSPQQQGHRHQQGQVEEEDMFA